MDAPSRTKYYRDKQNGKWAGVCAGLADYTGVEALWIRIGFIILTISFGWPLLAYIAMAMLSPVKPIGLYRTPDEKKFWQHVRANPARGSRDVRASFRELDRRLADIELYYTSRNTRLADEIESLR